MTAVRPEFLRVLPDDIARVGALGACILALVRYVTSLTSETNGRKMSDGSMWWRASHTDIGQSLGGVSRYTIRREIEKLQTAGDLLAVPAEKFYGDKALAYQVSDQPLCDSALGPDQPLCDSVLPIVRNRTSTKCDSAPPRSAESHFVPIREELEEEERERARRDGCEPLDVDTVPDPRNGSLPEDLLQDKSCLPEAFIGDEIVGELVDEKRPESGLVDPGPAPSKYCTDHPNGTPRKCGGCKFQREDVFEPWERASREWGIHQLMQAATDREADRADVVDHQPGAAILCHNCNDTGVVLNSDGKPGRHPRICNHDSTWTVMTEAELAEYGGVIEQLNSEAA
jgi:hypothetical protein